MSTSLKLFNNLDLAFKEIQRIFKKIRLKINNIPVFRARKEAIYQAELAARAPFLPKLNAEDANIVDCLQTTGACVIPLEQLQLASTEAMLKKAVKLSKTLQKNFIKNDPNSWSIELRKSELIKHPEVFLWGLETKLLNIVENYIGLPVIYQGSHIRRDLPNGRKVSVRKWHLDWEDRRMIKIIIYLNDVDIDGGPCEYISKDLTTRAVKALNYHNFNFLDDETIAAAVPQSDWQSCIGKAGTAIIIDTANVFHRAKPAVKQARYSISFCYTSDLAEVNWGSRGVSSEEWKKIDNQLNHYQRKCLLKI